MAVDTALKSVSITNRDATPAVLNAPGKGGSAVVREVSGYLASVTAALSIGSIIRMVEVPSNAIVSLVRFASAAQGAGSFNIGVYNNTRDGGAVVDFDYFAVEIDASSAVVLTDETNQSTTNTLAKQQQPLWQALGASTDPFTTYDIALTVAAANVTTGTGAVEVKVRYVQ